MTVHEFFTNSRMEGGHSFIRGFIRGWFVFAAKGRNPQADTSPLEREIDHAQRVAPRQLYGLTEDEIGIVENKT